jgi:alpha-tubulin suppressor-like RCC1 family protein
LAFSLLAFAICVALAVLPAAGAAPPGEPAPGQLYAFGDNVAAQLGNEINVETDEPNPIPVRVPLPEDDPVVQTAGSGLHTLAVTESGKAWALGYNYHGQLGNTTYNQGNGPHGWNPVPAEIVLPGQDGPIIQAAAGDEFSLIVTGGGQLYAFGNNSNGQLGNETNINQITGKANPTPTLVQLPGQEGPVVQAAAGKLHSLVVTASGQLYSFGNNCCGQLGRVTVNPPREWSNPTPTLVQLPEGAGPVVEVAAGAFFSLVRTANGKVYSFGENRYGQLGFEENSGPGPSPAENTHLAPTLVTLPGAEGPAVQIAAGVYHSLVLTASGQVYSFGENTGGQLGNTMNLDNHEANPTPTPVSIPGASGQVVEVGAGYAASYALTSTGRLYAFGTNWYGQLGRATNTKSLNPNPTPTAVPMPGGAAIETIAHITGNHMLVAIGMVLTTSSLSAGAEGVPYQAQVDVDGGEGPHQWSASGLPPGLSIDASGEISGTPTGIGCANALCIYTATITVKDDDGLEISRPFPVAIAPQKFTLKITAGGSGAGSVSSSPAGIDHCSPAGVDCESSFNDGTAVVLSADPVPGSTFGGWAGAGCSGTGACKVTLNDDTEVVATFVKVVSPGEEEPPPLPPVHQVPPKDAALRIGRVQPVASKPKVGVKGMVAMEAAGTVMVRVSAYLRGQKITASKPASIVNGHWRVQVPLAWAKRPAAPIFVAARFDGSPGVAAGQAKRRFKLG